MAEPVLVISSDPFLGASLEVLARGRVEIARLDPNDRPATWPGGPSTPVVLDLSARHRDDAYAWVRRHHPGFVVVLLKPGERDPELPPDPSRLVVRRPFRLADLVALLERPPRGGGFPRAEPPGAGAEPAGAGAGAASRELLQASAEQRRRRLGSFSVAAPGRRSAGRAARRAPDPAPVAAGPGDGGRLPRPDWPTAATRLDGRRRRRRGRRGRRVAARVLLGALVVLAVAGAWLGFGLLEAREDLRVGAAAVRAELARAEVALQRGDPVAAGAAVRAAGRNLDFAQAVPDRREMRVAAHLPVLSGGVSDARHLLAAARGLTGAGERGVAVAGYLRSGRTPLLREGRFDLVALGDATTQARELVRELELVRAELDQVGGGPLAPGAGETKRWALDRLEAATARARPLVPTLEALPAALGADRPRTYLVALTGLDQPRPSGGRFLALLEVGLDEGVVEVRTGDRALAEGVAGPSLRFPSAGQELAAAYRAQGRPRPDGVIAIDPLAVRDLLRATGPVEVPGHGRLDAATAVRQITRDPSVRFPDPAERRRHHEAVLGALVARFLSGRDLVATGRVLAAAGAGGNLQAYAADPALQRVLARHRLAGAP